jgi:hypothetical protein
MSAELFLVPWCCWPDFLCPFQITKSFQIESLGIFYLKKIKVFFGDAAAKGCKKTVSDFPGPSRDVTNQTIPGREQLYYSPPGRVVIWLGTGKSLTFFLKCTLHLLGKFRLHNFSYITVVLSIFIKIHI